MPSTISAILALALLAAPLAVRAGPIIAPATVVANVATRVGGPWSLTALIDQSGLSSPYVSGVTDFNTYLSSGLTHNSLFAVYTWATNEGVTAASLTFGLGAAITVNTLAIWNRGSRGQGIKDFRLFACQDADCSSELLLGSFTASTELGADQAVPAETFSFAATSASFVRMDILNGYNPTLESFGEVAFERTVLAVPEPGSLALVGLVLGCLVAVRRRRR